MLLVEHGGGFLMLAAQSLLQLSSGKHTFRARGGRLRLCQRKQSRNPEKKKPKTQARKKLPKVRKPERPALGLLVSQHDTFISTKPAMVSSRSIQDPRVVPAMLTAFSVGLLLMSICEFNCFPMFHVGDTQTYNHTVWDPCSDS